MEEAFSTDQLRFKVTERYTAAWVDPAAFFASGVNPLERLASAMERVATPYWPCSDPPCDP